MPTHTNATRSMATRNFSELLREFRRADPPPAGSLCEHSAREMTSPRRAALRVGTLNVHGWSNRDGKWTVTEITELLRSADLDVIALQEATAHRVPELAHALGDMHWVAAHNNAILTRVRCEPTDPWMRSGRGLKNSRRARQVPTKKRVGLDQQNVRFVGAVLHPDGESPLDALHVVGCHLDHVSEPRRISQLCALHDHVAAGAAGGDADGRGWPPSLLCGDFNALARSDYTDRQWATIAAVRQRNSWERPVTALTDLAVGAEQTRHVGAHGGARRMMHGLGLVDTRKAARRVEGPLSSCRFDTRIDYVLASPELVCACGGVETCEHVVAIPHASDHNLVVATFASLPGAVRESREPDACAEAT